MIPVNINTTVINFKNESLHYRKGLGLLPVSINQCHYSGFYNGFLLMGIPQTGNFKIE